MIKITNYQSSGYCKVYFDVEPVRPARIWEEEIGLAIALKSPSYSTDKNKEIYRIETSVPCNKTIAELKEMQHAAQEEFSLKIQKMRKRLDDLKLLQELIKKEEKKKDGKN